MPTLLDDAPPAEAVRDPSAAERLRTTMAATKVSFAWFGVRKSLSAAQKERAADSFAAEATFLSAAKKLLDTRHAAYQAVTTIRGQPQQLRDNDSLRQRVSRQMATVQAALDGLLVDRPRRAIIRPQRSEVS